ncbi:MAG: hypothetical protein Q9190_003319 [Brigantiaea leucoxantha]
MASNPRHKHRPQTSNPSEKFDSRHSRRAPSTSEFGDAASPDMPSSTAAMRPDLPFHAPSLRKRDFKTYESMFRLYLDIQKHMILEELSEKVIRGRWKSFVRKWNHGELAEGWYDPATLVKARTSTTVGSGKAPSQAIESSDEKAEDSDSFGPELPGKEDAYYRDGKMLGPAIPSLQDLELQRETQHEDSLLRLQDVRQARKRERLQQKERLDELVPRAESGTKDRRLEKKRELASANRAFANSKIDAGDMAEVNESELLGGDDESFGNFKRQKTEEKRKMNEREIRQEAILRARKEERMERIKVYKAKEEKTMSELIALAKARFGQSSSLG